MTGGVCPHRWQWQWQVDQPSHSPALPTHVSCPTTPAQAHDPQLHSPEYGGHAGHAACARHGPLADPFQLRPHHRRVVRRLQARRGAGRARARGRSRGREEDRGRGGGLCGRPIHGEGSVARLEVSRTRRIVSLEPLKDTKREGEQKEGKRTGTLKNLKNRLFHAESASVPVLPCYCVLASCDVGAEDGDGPGRRNGPSTAPPRCHRRRGDWHGRSLTSFTITVFFRHPPTRLTRLPTHHSCSYFPALTHAPSHTPLLLLLPSPARPPHALLTPSDAPLPWRRLG